MRSSYKLWLSEYDDGTADVSASIGDMAIMINDEGVIPPHQTYQRTHAPYPYH